VVDNSRDGAGGRSCSAIGTLNEKPLHRALKSWYARPDDGLEVALDGFVIDIVRGDTLIEIQTGSFSSIKRKLEVLTAAHPVRLVYPVARDRWIVRLVVAGSDDVLGRRRSPKHGGYEHLFAALVSFPRLMASPNFALEVLLIQEEELRRRDEKRGWRRHGWVVQERRLLDVVGRRRFDAPEDLVDLLPAGLPVPWSTADLARALPCRRRLAQQMAYCLREMDVIEPAGKQGNAILYARTRS